MRKTFQNNRVALDAIREVIKEALGEALGTVVDPNQTVPSQGFNPRRSAGTSLAVRGTEPKRDKVLNPEVEDNLREKADAILRAFQEMYVRVPGQADYSVKAFADFDDDTDSALNNVAPNTHNIVAELKRVKFQIGKVLKEINVQAVRPYQIVLLHEKMIQELAPLVSSLSQTVARAAKENPLNNPRTVAQLDNREGREGIKVLSNIYNVAKGLAPLLEKTFGSEGTVMKTMAEIKQVIAANQVDPISLYRDGVPPGVSWRSGGTKKVGR